MESKDYITPQVPVGEFYRSFVDLCKQQKIGVQFIIKSLPRREPPSNEVFVFTRPVRTSSENKEFSNTTPPHSFVAQPTSSVQSITSVGSEDHEETPIVAKFYIELDSPELGDSITQIFIKDWKVDERMFKVLTKSCVYLQLLSKIRLFGVGISSVTIILLQKWLSSIPNLKVLSLDNNPIPEDENHYILLNKPLDLHEVSFRFCNITDKGAALIAQSLNKNLIKLNLTGNEISDVGANALAEALRLNSTLLSLSLAGNNIENNGAEAFAKLISASKATKSEVKKRRLLLFDRIKENPAYKQSKTTGFYKDLLNAEPIKKAPNKLLEDALLEEKQMISRLLSLRREWSVKNSNQNHFEDKDVMTILSDMPKFSEFESDVFYSIGNTHESILMNKITFVQKKGYYFCGNLNLLNLNLAKNAIGQRGFMALYAAVLYQQQLPIKRVQPGLCKLTLTGNRIDEKSTSYLQIIDIMDKKDPITQYSANLYLLMEQNAIAAETS